MDGLMENLDGPEVVDIVCEDQVRPWGCVMGLSLPVVSH